MAACVLVLLMILTWKVIAQSLFMYLYGRTWIATALPIVGMLLFMGLAALGTYVVRTPAALHAARACAPLDRRRHPDDSIDRRWIALCLYPSPGCYHAPASCRAGDGVDCAGTRVLRLSPLCDSQ